MTPIGQVKFENFFDTITLIKIPLEKRKSTQSFVVLRSR